MMKRLLSQKQPRSSLVCVDCRLRPCISFAIVLYHCSAPASASSSFGTTTPPEKRAQLHQRHEVQPLLETPSSCASWCVELLNGRLKQPLIHTTPNKSTGHPELGRPAFDVRKQKKKSESEDSQCKNLLCVTEEQKPATPRGLQSKRREA